MHLDGERRARTRIPHIARGDDVHLQPEYGPVHSGDDGEWVALGQLDGALSGEDEGARVERAGSVPRFSVPARLATAGVSCWLHR